MIVSGSSHEPILDTLEALLSILRLIYRPHTVSCDLFVVATMGRSQFVLWNATRDFSTEL